MSLRRAAAVGCWLALWACRAQPGPAPAASKQAVAAPAEPTPGRGAAAPTAPPTAAARPLLRVVDDAGSQQLQAIEGFGQCALTTPGKPLTLDLQGGARVRIEPDSRACVLELLPTSLFMISGGVYAQLLPQANPTGRPELRLVTTQGSFLLNSGAELWVSQRIWPGDDEAVSSQTYLAVLRGQAQGTQLESLEAGRELAFGMPLEPRAPHSVEDARRAGARAMLRRGTPIRLSTADGPLEGLLAAIREQRQIGADLLARLPSQRAAAASEEIRAYQRDLAEHAQRKHRTREALVFAVERKVVAMLAVCAQRAGGIAECPAYGAWRGRFEGPVREAVGGAVP